MVITGKVEGFTRREIKDLMERHGANVTSSVSGETDYLVEGENPRSTKLEKAEDLNTDLLEADEFKTEFLEKVS